MLGVIVQYVFVSWFVFLNRGFSLKCKAEVILIMMVKCILASFFLPF